MRQVLGCWCCFKGKEIRVHAIGDNGLGRNELGTILETPQSCTTKFAWPQQSTPDIKLECAVSARNGSRDQ
jgi:hypothetical protein